MDGAYAYRLVFGPDEVVYLRWAFGLTFLLIGVLVATFWGAWR